MSTRGQENLYATRGAKGRQRKVSKVLQVTFKAMFIFVAFTGLRLVT
jgi:hypothetical protein